ncbi:MAG: hypothetical protein RBR81_03695 [Bacteroidales bacterium]|nr:hypothetical protein [Bacteroidales bacterium]
MRQGIYIIMVVAFLLCQTAATSQNPGTDVQTKLAGLYDRLISSRNDEEKLGINDSIRSLIGSYAASDTAIIHRFDKLRYLGQIVSPDKKVKIINWNLILEDQKSRYYCYIIHKPSRNKAGRICALEAEYREEPADCGRFYHDSDWYGSLYYDIMPVKKSGIENWIILGIDYGNQFITRKVIDVISFDEEGRLSLGRKWFVSDDDIKYREVFEYSSEAVMSLRFTGARSIVFDHLVPLSPGLKDSMQHYAPDYSYDAYYFKDGMWRFEQNVDIRNRKD